MKRYINNNGVYATFSAQAVAEITQAKADGFWIVIVRDINGDLNVVHTNQQPSNL